MGGKILVVVCDTAKVRFFKQITTCPCGRRCPSCCLRYCKSTIFQANHNPYFPRHHLGVVVCDTAKVRFFKQITTAFSTHLIRDELFAILQKYDFSSKSQLKRIDKLKSASCLRYCKSTIFQANHNWYSYWPNRWIVVCDTAKVRFFKQITTEILRVLEIAMLFAILQKYDFSSKSQPLRCEVRCYFGCLRYCKSTIFQANHNNTLNLLNMMWVVCDTAKVRFFKQITTATAFIFIAIVLFAILQKYDFSSKSQQEYLMLQKTKCCLRYCKSTIFQANHNR